MASKTLQDFKNRQDENHSLYDQYINPHIKKVMSILGINTNFIKAEGCYLYDKAGNRYLDFNTGEGVISVGFNHPRVVYILNEILNSFSPNMLQLNSNVLAGLLAEKLLSKAPDHFKKVYFGNSGGEAVDTAIKFARRTTGKARIIYCQSSFHGLTYGGLSICGDPEFKEGFTPLLPETTAIPFNDVAALEQELKQGDVAGFITEPIQGRAITLAKDGYLKEAQRLCHKYKALFILDEIQTALGRTGKFFAMEHWNLEPDMLLIAKALSGGLIPVSSVLMTEEIYKKVYSPLDRCYVHHTTYGSNNMAMAAGLATIEVIEEENLVENSKNLGEQILSKLNQLKERYELISDVRGMGLMFGIEFGKPKSFKLKLSWDLIHKASRGLFPQLIVIPMHKEHRIVTMVSGYNDVIKCIPPLTLTEEDMNYFINSLEKVLDGCHSSGWGMWSSMGEMVKNVMKGQYISPSK